jgi:hypothetical protein
MIKKCRKTFYDRHSLESKDTAGRVVGWERGRRAGFKLDPYVEGWPPVDYGLSAVVTTTEPVFYVYKYKLGIARRLSPTRRAHIAF